MLPGIVVTQNSKRGSVFGSLHGRRILCKMFTRVAHAALATRPSGATARLPARPTPNTLANSDLSAEAEALVQARADKALADLGVAIEVKNQARVHLWYREHFGNPYPRLACATDGIDRFLIPSTSLGVRPTGDGYEIYAPNGLDLVYQGVLAPNPLVDHRNLFLAKARSYRDRWPWLQVRSELADALHH